MGVASDCPVVVPLPSGQTSAFGIYIHVPFCAGVCPYCDFTKTGSFTAGDVEVFFSLANQQLGDLLAVYAPSRGSVTLYLGGGTPGMFPAWRYEALVRAVTSRYTVEEFTVEMNPHQVSAARLDAFYQLGVRRLTLGVQSLDPGVLKALGRRHKPEMALQAIEQAALAGMSDIHVDVIFGLRPGLRLMPIKQEVEALLRAGATGISAYALTLEERTRLWGSGLVDSDNAVDDYQAIVETCGRWGLVQLEVANFGRGLAKHNNVYWYGYPYLGVGTGAHGLVGPASAHPFGRRYRVGACPVEQAPGDDKLPFALNGEGLFELEWESPRTRREQLFELVLTLLRTPDGLPRVWLEREDSRIIECILSDVRVLRGIEEGRLASDERGLRLVGLEFLLADAWATHLIQVLGNAPYICG